MQAPSPPIDIQIAMGSDKDSQNLTDINISLSDSKQSVQDYLKKKKLDGFGQDCVLIFDLYTQKGKQKQAYEYFNQQNGKSPLQIMFGQHNRPEKQSAFCKFSIQPHHGQNFIRITYRFVLQQSHSQAIDQILNTFAQNNLKLQSNINLTMKGKVSHTNNNRTNVLVNYTKFHLISNVFCSQNLINSLLAFNDFQNNFQYYIKNPFFSLIKKSKIAKINVHIDSFRKLSKYYNKVSGAEKEKQAKQFKYLNKGIFRQKATATMIYNDKYLINVSGVYESQDVFIRLVKVYSKFFQNILNTTLYDDS